MMALGFGSNANPPEILKSRGHRLPIGKRANVNNYYRSLGILRFSGPRNFIAKDLEYPILESINDKSSDPQNFFAKRPFLRNVAGYRGFESLESKVELFCRVPISRYR